MKYHLIYVAFHLGGSSLFAKVSLDIMDALEIAVVCKLYALLHIKPTSEKAISHVYKVVYESLWSTRNTSLS